MEYIEHGDLSQYITKCNKTNAREITVQLLEGLTILHGLAICHRDLKPKVPLPPSLLLCKYKFLIRIECSCCLTAPRVG